jgi:hypothetical protein
MISKVVIVTGSRDWEYGSSIYDALHLHQPDLVVQGGCPTGADRFARCWCDENNVKYRTVSADWNKYGKAAGPIRNREMLEAYPTATVLAFCRDNSRGTRGTIGIARELGMIVIIDEYEIL